MLQRYPDIRKIRIFDALWKRRFFNILLKKKKGKTLYIEEFPKNAFNFIKNSSNDLKSVSPSVYHKVQDLTRSQKITHIPWQS